MVGLILFASLLIAGSVASWAFFAAYKLEETESKLLALVFVDREIREIPVIIGESDAVFSSHPMDGGAPGTSSVKIHRSIDEESLKKLVSHLTSIGYQYKYSAAGKTYFSRGENEIVIDRSGGFLDVVKFFWE